MIPKSGCRFSEKIMCNKDGGRTVFGFGMEYEGMACWLPLV